MDAIQNTEAQNQVRKMFQQIGQCASVSVQIGEITTGAVNGHKGKQRQKAHDSPDCFVSLYVAKNIFHFNGFIE